MDSQKFLVAGELRPGVYVHQAYESYEKANAEFNRLDIAGCAYCLYDLKRRKYLIANLSAPRYTLGVSKEIISSYYDSNISRVRLLAKP